MIDLRVQSSKGFTDTAKTGSKRFALLLRSHTFIIHLPNANSTKGTFAEVGRHRDY
jgi:hypothetical protein